MLDREQILRDLEYIDGGIVATKICCSDNKEPRLYDLMKHWHELLINVIDQIAKETEYAKDS